jgi:tRNA-splicing ligase RtcB (3'-phosphate/5'-hydroxy nucleic acid ligase)
MDVIQTENNGLVKTWCPKDSMEEGALEQISNAAQHPAVFKHVALMPDAHSGYGLPIGGVMALINAVSPFCVGVDIGCGMCAVEADIDVDDLTEEMIKKMMGKIRQLIPMGFGKKHLKKQWWVGFDEYARELNEFDNGDNHYTDLFKWEVEDLPKWYTDKAWDSALCSLGTLGSGNHFIQLSKDQNNQLWLMLHSGSRNIGYIIADYYHKLAIKLNKKWHSTLPSEKLAFLPTDSIEGKMYIRDMNFALRYAEESRNRMMGAMRLSIEEGVANVKYSNEVNIHHNYATLENHFGKNVWVHRKGATSAREGQLGIIPGSMGTNSYIVKGLGNPQSYMSCSHGAGRTMSRSKASAELNVDDCNRDMEGVIFGRWSTVKDRKTKKEKIDLSEAPAAYKDIEEVMKNQADLVEIVYTLKPIAVLKG